MKRYLLIALLLSSLTSNAQIKYEYGIEYKQKVGILLAHHEIMAHLASDLCIKKNIKYAIFFRK